jgi:hypothetical protein
MPSNFYDNENDKIDNDTSASDFYEKCESDHMPQTSSLAPRARRRHRARAAAAAATLCRCRASVNSAAMVESSVVVCLFDVIVIEL